MTDENGHYADFEDWISGISGPGSEDFASDLYHVLNHTQFPSLRGEVDLLIIKAREFFSQLLAEKYSYDHEYADSLVRSSLGWLITASSVSTILTRALEGKCNAIQHKKSEALSLQGGYFSCCKHLFSDLQTNGDVLYGLCFGQNLSVSKWLQRERTLGFSWMICSLLGILFRWRARRKILVDQDSFDVITRILLSLRYEVSVLKCQPGDSGNESRVSELVDFREHGAIMLEKYFEIDAFYFQILLMLRLLPVDLFVYWSDASGMRMQSEFDAFISSSSHINTESAFKEIFKCYLSGKQFLPIPHGGSLRESHREACGRDYELATGRVGTIHESNQLEVGVGFFRPAFKAIRFPSSSRLNKLKVLIIYDSFKPIPLKVLPKPMVGDYDEIFRRVERFVSSLDNSNLEITLRFHPKSKQNWNSRTRQDHIERMRLFSPVAVSDSGSVEKLIKNSDVLVVLYPETCLSQALLGNKPCVLFDLLDIYGVRISKELLAALRANRFIINEHCEFDFGEYLDSWDSPEMLELRDKWKKFIFGTFENRIELARVFPLKLFEAIDNGFNP